MAIQSTTALANALRGRAKQMIGQGVNAVDLLYAADEMDRLNECGFDDDSKIASAIAALKSFIGGRIDALCTDINQLKEIIQMSLQPEVQALLDAVTAQGEAITASNTEMAALEVSVSTLTAQLAAIPAGAPVDAEDLASIVAMTGTVSASVASLKAAMPTVVPAPVVAAAATS